MNVALPRSLNVDQYLAWAERQEQGKYELVDGVVIKQQSQTWGPAKVKSRVFNALERAIETRRLPYFAAPDGVADRTAFEPDALVAPLPEPETASLEIPNPIVVVEVLSPSTARIDAPTKLRGYFEVASVQHYLILDPEGNTVTHHKRGSGEVIETRILNEGIIALDPPGIEIRVGDLFAPVNS